MTKLTIPSSDAKTTSTSSPTRGIQSHFTREAKMNSFRKVSFLKGHLSLSNNNNNEILNEDYITGSNSQKECGRSHPSNF